MNKKVLLTGGVVNWTPTAAGTYTTKVQHTME